MPTPEIIGWVVAHQNQVLLSRSQFELDVARILRVDETVSIGGSPVYELPYVVMPSGDKPVSELSRLARDVYGVDFIPETSPMIDVANVGLQAVCRVVRSRIGSLPTMFDDDWRLLDLRLPGHRTPDIELGPIAQKVRKLVQDGYLEP